MGSVLAGFYYRNLELGIRYIPTAFPVRFFQPVTFLTALYGQSLGHMIDCFDNFCTDKSLYHMISWYLSIKSDYK